MEFVRKNGSSLRSLGWKWEDMILPGRENSRNCMDPDEMKMRGCLSTPGSPKYVLPVAQSTSVTLVSLYTRRRSLTIYSEALIKRVERCTWRPRSSELRDSLGGHDQVNSGIHSEAVIEQVWRCTWRPRSSELRDALGGRDWASLKIHLQAMIEWDCRSNWKRSIWREAWRQLRLYSLINLELWECRELSTITFAERWETAWVRETVDLGIML